jgi:hypothetical protein
VSQCKPAAAAAAAAAGYQLAAEPLCAEHACSTFLPCVLVTAAANLNLCRSVEFTLTAAAGRRRLPPLTLQLLLQVNSCSGCLHSPGY